MRWSRLPAALLALIACGSNGAEEPSGRSDASTMADAAALTEDAGSDADASDAASDADASVRPDSAGALDAGLTGDASRSANGCASTYVASDTVRDYLNLQAPTAPGSIPSIRLVDPERGTYRTTSGYVKHDNAYFGRGNCAGGNNPGWGCEDIKTEFSSRDAAYMPDGDPDTVTTFERHSFDAEAVVPVHYYREIYFWDPNFENLYLWIASATGEADYTVDPSECTDSGNTAGCSFGKVWGQVWIPNLVGTVEAGTTESGAIYLGQSNAVQPSGGISYDLDDDPDAQGSVGFSIQATGCGEVWFRSSFDAADLESYIAGTNQVGPSPHPYTDTLNLGETRPALTLDLQSVFINRVYSGCGPHPGLTEPAPPAADCTTPWTSCGYFEDHVYGKDSHGLPLGEVAAVTGSTPLLNAGAWQISGGYAAMNTYCN